jgi:hypothetical protein
MQSRTTRRFWRLFSQLPVGAQRDAKRSYRLFRTNPAHPGLQFKKLEGEDNIYSVRIGLEYRALAVMNQRARGVVLDRQSPRVRPFDLRRAVHMDVLPSRTRATQGVPKRQCGKCGMVFGCIVPTRREATPRDQRRRTDRHGLTLAAALSTVRHTLRWGETHRAGSA